MKKHLIWAVLMVAALAWLADTDAFRHATRHQQHIAIGFVIGIVAAVAILVTAVRHAARKPQQDQGRSGFTRVR